MDNNLLTAFIALTAFAVLLQAGILVALYLALRTSTAKMEALATEMRDKTAPAIETAHNLMLDLRPKVDAIATNLGETTTLVRSQLERVDATLSDALDRT